VIPMLPEKLSNDLCSLNANTKKLTLSCEIILDKNGIVTSSKVYNSVIKSSYRLTYKEVEKIFLKQLSLGDELSFGGLITPGLINAINFSYELKRIINKNKQKLGVLNFDFDETKVILDEKNNPIDIIKYERLESHKVIEEFMILANENIGYLFSKIPFLYRVHETPDEEDIEKFKKILASFDIILPYKEINPILISDILEKINSHPKKMMLSKIILRSLKKANYSQNNLGHFGLALDFYSHFTSPIRRYADLQIHRIIKEYLQKNKLEKSRISHYKENLEEISKHISETEVKSEKLEYAVRDLMIAKYYKDKIGEEFEGIISGMIPIGFFVVLDNSAEGLVSLEDFLNQQKYKKYKFEDDILKLTFENNFSLQVGDKIKIKISIVDLET
ncbi:MAG: RNB domain-containing ribonuclease, partial [Candidatus Gracilibacteria bacterium]|nr:RNB domain-containing ribonuclease [Candidatus Gracilibacteria bacterium]